jgi:hypothetical protein
VRKVTCTRSAYCPSSFPNPDCLNPPNGTFIEPRPPEFTHKHVRIGDILAGTYATRPSCVCYLDNIYRSGNCQLMNIRSLETEYVPSLSSKPTGPNISPSHCTVFAGFDVARPANILLLVRSTENCAETVTEIQKPEVIGSYIKAW